MDKFYRISSYECGTKKTVCIKAKNKGEAMLYGYGIFSGDIYVEEITYEEYLKKDCK